jgi:SseB protein C-terminal domain
MIPIKKKPSEQVWIQNICFIGEQKGMPEDVLKKALINFFLRDKSVHRAYLAIIADNGKPSITLCLRSQFGPDKGMVEKIGIVFASVFNSQQHLDIIFLDGQQEIGLLKVCQPFFEIGKL